MINIRTATNADAKAIAELHCESWQLSYKGHLNSEYLAEKVPQERKIYWQERFDNASDDQHILVAEVNDIIVGFACVYFDKYPKWGSYLDNLHVSQKQQSKGIGLLLLKAVAQACNTKASSKGLCLLVTQFNTGAQRFYQRYGAINQEPSTWLAPEGTTVPTYWFIWDLCEAIDSQ